MLLEKPQSEAVETILTDCYNAGREAVIKALFDYMDLCSKSETNNVSNKIAYCSKFYSWYLKNSKKYEMKFKVSDK